MSSKVNVNGLTAADFLGSEPDPEPLALEVPARQRAILQIVKSSPDGLTLSDIEDQLARLGMKAARHTIRSDLSEREREREVYVHQARERSPLMYFPNGRLIHPLLKVSKDLRGTTYQATVQDSRRGPAIQLQERSFSIMNGEKVEGAIFVDFAIIDDFLALIQEIKARYESHKEANTQ